MNRKWKKELKEIYAVEKPEKKKDFLIFLPYPRISKKEFFNIQFTYIRKRYWIITLLFSLLLLLYTYIFQLGNSAIGLFSAMLPFLSLFGITEIQKSTVFNMEELEMTCRNNLGEIMLSRFLIIASYDFLIFLLLIFILTNQTGYGFFRNMIYLFTPFLLSTGLSLLVSNYSNRKNILQICAIVSCSVSIIMGNLQNFAQILYSSEMIIVWWAVFFIILCLTIIEMKKNIKRTEELKWNLSLID